MNQLDVHFLSDSSTSDALPNHIRMLVRLYINADKLRLVPDHRLYPSVSTSLGISVILPDSCEA